jgi:hypothetical protein
VSDLSKARLIYLAVLTAMLVSLVFFVASVLSPLAMVDGDGG